MTHGKDYYAVLGVDRRSTIEDIKTKYRRLASIHHPDKGGDETVFKEIQEAYDAITIEHSSASFDTFIHRYNNNNGRFFTSIRLEEAYTGGTIHTDIGQIQIPRGVRDGTKLAVGNDIVTILVDEHDKFIRDKDNLVLTVSISSLEAITGIDLKVSMLDGSTVEVRIPEGIRYAETIRVLGSGMPNPQTGRFGDLFITVVFDTPFDLTLDQKVAILAIVNRKSASV